MRCSVEAQWCWYCCKHHIAGGIQSVENQVDQEVEPIEEIVSADSREVGVIMSC